MADEGLFTLEGLFSLRNFSLLNIFCCYCSWMSLKIPFLFQIVLIDPWRPQWAPGRGSLWPTTLPESKLQILGPRPQSGANRTMVGEVEEIDLLSDGQHQTLPFQVAVPSVHQPVYRRNTQITAFPFPWPKFHHWFKWNMLRHWLKVVFILVKVWGSQEDGNEDRPEGMLGAKQTLATWLHPQCDFYKAIASTQG